MQSVAKFGWNSMYLLVILGLAVLTSGCVRHTQVGGQVSVKSQDSRVAIAFSKEEQALIRDYYRKNLPPGLAKKGKVPPGHQKKLARNDHLPPSAKWEALPRDLEVRLRPLPDGHIRVRVGADVLILNSRTRLILDVLHDV